MANSARKPRAVAADGVVGAPGGRGVAGAPGGRGVAGAPGGRGAPGRVAEAHAQARRGLGVAAAFLAAAVVAAVIGIGPGWWVPLHLFALGSLLSAISAATVMFAVTWSAAPSPSPIAVRAQRWALAAGALAVVVGRANDWTWLVFAGGAAVIVAMAVLAVVLGRVWRQQVTDRYGPAIETYVAAIVAGVAGMSIGVLLATGHGGGRTTELREAHVVLNLFGLVGLVIAATLPFFTATQVRSKMSRRATPAAMRTTFVVLAAATAVAATGAITGNSSVVAGGLILYAIALAVIAALLPVYRKGGLRWGGPRVVQLLAGIAWWAAMTVALAVANVRGTDDRAILQALVIGGFAQILVASLAYLGPVLRGGGHQRLTAGFALTRSWFSLIVGNVAAVAAFASWDALLAVALAVWLVDVVVRGARLVNGIPRTPRRDALP